MVGTTTRPWCVRRGSIGSTSAGREIWFGPRCLCGVVTMSKEIRLSLFALVLLPLLAIWFFWRRPQADSKRESSPDSRSDQGADAAPVALAPTATSPVAPSEHEVKAEAATEPTPSSSAVGDDEPRSRRLVPPHPTLRRDPPSGCNPPYTIDHDGNKVYKKECL